ncbi:MAG TPA: hypothetical protein VMP08_14815 [Anaerolineae bacterium]|nr:hypothetical protein [Anaerolineae bacterium]
MKTKLAKALSVVVLLTLLIVPAAYAAPADHHVHCEGSGFAYLRGDMTIDVGARVGALAFHNISGDGVLTVTGIGHKIVRGAWTYVYGFNGAAHAAGTLIGVTLSGRKVVLDATGHGVVQVRGIGFCTIDGTQTQWASTTQELAISE